MAKKAYRETHKEELKAKQKSTTRAKKKKKGRKRECPRSQ